MTAPVLADATPNNVNADGTVHTGAMVALVPSEADCKRLAVPGGEPASQLHLTLLFLGKASDIPDNCQASIITKMNQIAELFPPVEADGFSINVFNPNVDDDGDKETCIVLGCGGTELARMHMMVNIGIDDACGESYPVPDQHKPWIPHVTLEYTNDVAKAAQYIDRVGPITFDRLRVAYGGDVHDVKLTGPEYKKAPKPKHKSTEPQKCKYCKDPAKHSIIHSEGMAYIPVCASHLKKGKDDAAHCVPGGKNTPSNIDAIRAIKAELPLIRALAMLETKRVVRTAEGARRFGVPIGSVIGGHSGRGGSRRKLVSGHGAGETVAPIHNVTHAPVKTKRGSIEHLPNTGHETRYLDEHPQLLEAMQSAFEMRHGDFQTYVQPEQSGFHNGRFGKKIEVAGEIRHKGQKVGEFTRTIHPDKGLVYNDDLTLEPEYQGQRFADAFYKQSEAALHQHGITHVGLDADRDVGGYAWARRGFVWDTNNGWKAAHSSLLTVQNRIENTLADHYDGGEYKGREKLTDEDARQLETWHRAFKDATNHIQASRKSVSLDELKDMGVPLPQEVASFGEGRYNWNRKTKAGKSFTSHPGKDIMLGSRWDATKSIDPMQYKEDSANYHRRLAAFYDEADKQFVPGDNYKPHKGKKSDYNCHYADLHMGPDSMRTETKTVAALLDIAYKGVTRVVRTAEGARKFGVPIGTVIRDRGHHGSGHGKGTERSAGRAIAGHPHLTRGEDEWEGFHRIHGANGQHYDVGFDEEVGKYVATHAGKWEALHSGNTRKEVMQALNASVGREVNPHEHLTRGDDQYHGFHRIIGANGQHYDVGKDTQIGKYVATLAGDWNALHTGSSRAEVMAQLNASVGHQIGKRVVPNKAPKASDVVPQSAARVHLHPEHQKEVDAITEAYGHNPLATNRELRKYAETLQMEPGRTQAATQRRRESARAIHAMVDQRQNTMVEAQRTGKGDAEAAKSVNAALSIVRNQPDDGSIPPSLVTSLRGIRDQLKTGTLSRDEALSRVRMHANRHKSHEVVGPALSRAAAKLGGKDEGTPKVAKPNYDSASYRRGFAAAARDGSLERADHRGEPNEWYDGYHDAAAGREKYTLRDHRDTVEGYSVGSSVPSVAAPKIIKPKPGEHNYTLPNGTVATRKSQNHVYTHAVMVTTNQHAQAGELERRASRLREAANKWDEIVKSGDTSSLGRVATSWSAARGAHYSSTIPGYEDLSGVRGVVSLPDYKDQEDWNHPEYGAHHSSKKMREYAAQDEKRAAELRSGPSHTYEIGSWHSTAQHAMKASSNWQNLKHASTRVVQVNGPKSSQKEVLPEAHNAVTESRADRLKRLKEAGAVKNPAPPTAPKIKPEVTNLSQRSLKERHQAGQSLNRYETISLAREEPAYFVSESAKQVLTRADKGNMMRISQDIASGALHPRDAADRLHRVASGSGSRHSAAVMRNTAATLETAHSEHRVVPSAQPTPPKLATSYAPAAEDYQTRVDRLRPYAVSGSSNYIRGVNDELASAHRVHQQGNAEGEHHFLTRAEIHAGLRPKEDWQKLTRGEDIGAIPSAQDTKPQSGHDILNNLLPDAGIGSLEQLGASHANAFRTGARLLDAGRTRAEIADMFDTHARGLEAQSRERSQERATGERYLKPISPQEASRAHRQTQAADIYRRMAQQLRSNNNAKPITSTRPTGAQKAVAEAKETARLHAAKLRSLSEEYNTNPDAKERAKQYLDGLKGKELEDVIKELGITAARGTVADKRKHVLAFLTYGTEMNRVFGNVLRGNGGSKALNRALALSHKGI